MKVELIVGGRHGDDRGVLRFCNDFDMSEVKRFYTVANSCENPFRGWIEHRMETKWFFPVKGMTTVRVVADGKIIDYVLRDCEPAVLKVPGGHPFAIVQDGNAEVMVFSNCLVGEFVDDDIRYPEKHFGEMT